MNLLRALMQSFLRHLPDIFLAFLAFDFFAERHTFFIPSILSESMRNRSSLAAVSSSSTCDPFPWPGGAIGPS